MADSNLTELNPVFDEPLKEEFFPWGSEYRLGTKEQLQAIGIGVGLAFPGEPGARPRQITVRDSRGWKVRIKRDHTYTDGTRLWTGKYSARSLAPKEIIQKNRAKEQRKAEIYAAANRAKLAGVDKIDASLAALRIDALETDETENGTEHEFREKFARAMCCRHTLAQYLHASQDSSFFFDKKIAPQIEHHLRAIENIIFAAEVKSDPEAQRASLLELYALIDLDPPSRLKTQPKRALFLVK